MAFKPIDNEENLVVNHIDGDKSNDDLDNLEWCTQRENVEHAGKTGLTEKCSPVVVTDLSNGEKVKYPSIVTCAKALGVSKDTVIYHLSNSSGRIRSKWKIVLDNPKFGNSTPVHISAKGNRFRAVLVKSHIGKCVLRFDSISHASANLDVKLPTLYTWMQRDDQPVLPGYIQLKWADDSRPWREVSDIHLELSLFTGTKPVVVKSANGCWETVFPSGTECAKSLGISTTLLHYRLKSAGKKVFPDGNRYAYYKPLPIEHSPPLW